jgi:hypothetical protein
VTDRFGITMSRDQARSLIDVLLHGAVPANVRKQCVELAEEIDDAQGRLDDGEFLRLELFEPGD